MEIASKMLEHTQMGSDMLDAVKLGKVIGATCFLNTSTNSNEYAWNEELRGRIDLSFEVFNRIVHQLELANPEKDSTTSSWIPSPELQKLYREYAHRSMLRLYSSGDRLICLDDDIQNSLSSQIERGEAASVCVTRKKRWMGCCFRCCV